MTRVLVELNLNLLNIKIYLIKTYLRLKTSSLNKAIHNENSPPF